MTTMGMVTEAELTTVPKVKKPQKVAVTRVKGPSSLSMGTADILKMLSTASPSTVGVSMRALQDVERSEERADRGLDVLRRRAEAEADTEKQQAKRRGPPKILTKRDWVRSQPHFAHLKDPKKKRLTKVERQSTDAGYEAYLARVAAQAKLDLSYSKDYQQAQETIAYVAKMRADTEKANRANRPDSLEKLVTRRLMNQQRIRPQTRQMWTEKHSKDPGIVAQDERAGRTLALKKKQYEDDFEYKQGIDILKAKAGVEKAQLDRESREKIAEGSVAQKNHEKIAELLMALEDITPRGKPGKPREKVDWWPDTAATPRTYPDREAVETAFHDMEGILAGLRAYGYDEARIAELRRVHGEKFLKTMKPSEEVNGAATDANR